jgi:DNA (cytosine-5)-methyltransferase 1
MKTKFIHGSCFSGIGGMDLAARWAGIATTWQIEKDVFCQRVLKKNFPEAKRYGNIGDVNETELQRVDIISGGPPCQPFSRANPKRKGKADERHLWPEMYRIIRYILPRWVLIENVPDIINFGVLDEIGSNLESAGYTWEAFIVPASFVGAWHQRHRVWILAHVNVEGLQGDVYFRRFSETIWGFQTETRQELSRILTGYRGAWSIEPSVGRVVHGLPRRVDRCSQIKALGNSVVPQVAFTFFYFMRKVSESQIFPGKPLQ